MWKGISAVESWSNWLNFILSLFYAAAKIPCIGPILQPYVLLVSSVGTLLNLIFRNFKTSEPIVSLLPKKKEEEI